MGKSDETESSLKDWKAIAVDFSFMESQFIRGNVSSENYTIFHDVNFERFERLKSEDQNSFTMESLILAQDER